MVQIGMSLITGEVIQMTLITIKKEKIPEGCVHVLLRLFACQSKQTAPAGVAD